MDDLKPDFVTAEYNNLRAEILKREEIRYQLIALTVTVFGALLAFGSQTKNATSILLYPVLALCLAISWRSNLKDIWNLSDYIIEHIETKVGIKNMYWERFRKLPWEELRGDKFLENGNRGIFVLTEVLALIIGFIVGITQPESNNILIFYIGVGISILMTIATIILLFIYESDRDKRDRDKEIAGAC